MNAIALYFRYIGISARGQMQYPMTFLMQAAGHGLLTAMELVGIWALFRRFGDMGTWTLPQVALMYALVGIIFALADSVSRGLDAFGFTVRSGDFDRMLLRPRSTILQLLGQELTMKRVGRVVQATIILMWAWMNLGLGVEAARLALLLISIVSGICLFLAMFVLQATVCFWTVESLEMWNVVTYGACEAAQYPMSEFRAWFRRFFTFVVPLVCVVYFPAVQIIGREDPLGTPEWIAWIAPLAGPACLMVALRVWRFGVRHYTSVGA